MNQDIKNRIDTINKPDTVRLFFKLTKQLIDHLKLDEKNEKLAITIQNDNRNRYTVNLNGRIILTINNGVEFGFMVNDDDLVTIEKAVTLKRKGEFSETWNQASWITIDYDVLLPNLEVIITPWLKSCLDYEPAMQKSPYRRHHVPELYQMAISPELVEEYIAAAPFTPVTFASVVSDLRDYIKGEKGKLADFTIQPLSRANSTWVWVSDAEGIIGNAVAHYEVRLEHGKEVAVALHFEGKKMEKEMFYKRIRSLPENINWSPWQDARSLRYTPRTKLNDPELMQKICSQLFYFEDKLGNAVREIMRNPGMANGDGTSATDRKPLNQILYGPPGTGKTYHTINKALEIIGEDLSGKTREDVRILFDRKVREGLIVFTTFHQSMSYEDFIEGIKPQEPEEKGQQPTYSVEDGIFKRACAMAGFLCYQSYEKSKPVVDPFTFDDLYDEFLEDLQAQINKRTTPVYKSITGKDIEIIAINRNDSIIAQPKGTKSKHHPPCTRENLQKLYDRFNSIEEIESLKLIKDTIEINPSITEFYAVFSGLKAFEKEKFRPDVAYVQESMELGTFDPIEIQKKYNAGVYDFAVRQTGIEKPPVILIIDEINRGNVSGIFGELITLIEEDKRQGKEEALEVLLPYSKLPFSVPQNLYIIGTMNTADRSVEALDTALRRRFCFEEIMPDYGLKEIAYEFAGVKIPELLETINNRIEKLIDRDHAIGHSYFIFKRKEGEDLSGRMKQIFYRNIIPLLQEYFYGDYGKIGLVLGDGFVKRKEWDNDRSAFADFDTDSATGFEDREVYGIIDYRNEGTKHVLTLGKDQAPVQMTFEKAVRRLMKLNIA